MGNWLDYFRNKQAGEVQGNLLGPPETSDIVIDHTSPSQKLAYTRLQDLVKARGGDQRTHAVVNADCIQYLLGVAPNDLYDALGVPRSKRERLPTEAQEVLMVGNLAAFYAILEDESQGHDSIIESSQKGFTRARKIFPWNRE
ncbi:hypothetical protein ACQ4N7_23410 [Nodosilinea sp. AN01ver1]|uniref:hypothetical protein n=1 Tax=Nodosilinea sp. AN01ver1 TaxID=3423362 RepID=UPI003D30F43C